MSDTAKNGLLRVNFSLRGFAKVINQSNLTAFTPEPAALEAFGRYLASLNLVPDDPITFTSVPEFRGIDYVGYIVEKERLDSSSGTWERLEEYRIVGAKACSYKDTRVAYGQVYRYRIRTVVKFTAAIPQQANFSLITQDLATLLQQTVASSATTNQPLLQRLAPAGLQSQADVNNQRFVSLTDNVTISVDAKGVPKFNYSVSSPAVQAANSQALTSLQGLQSALASSQPISNATLQSHINNLQNYAPQSTFNSAYTSEYLVSYPSRNWQYVSTRNDSLPGWPEAIQVVPCTPSSSISVYWLTPPDSQQDLASFNVYRRVDPPLSGAEENRWTMVTGSVPLDTAVYVDNDVQMGKKYTYAVQSNSVHGFYGFLSTQIQAELNPSFTFEQKEKDLVWVSGPGARPDEPDTIFAAFYDSNEQLIAYKNAAISPSMTFNDTDATVVLKVRSLDTQEKRQFVLKLHNKSNTQG